MASETQLNCRMYEQKFPEVDDLVMVSVKSIAEMGAYVSLLEYNNIEGMILLSELSRRRIRSITKLIRVGRQEVVVVLRVDKEKGYIDLSKRRVSPEEIAKCEEKYNKSKAVHSIMRHVAEVTHSNTEDLYKAFGWPLYKRFGHAYDAFKALISDPSILMASDITIDETIKECLIKDINRRLTPLFVMVTTASDKESGIKLLNQALEVVSQEIKTSKGELVVKHAPRAISEHDETELSEKMEEYERQNQEIPGDAPSDEEEAESGEDGETEE